MDPARQAAAFRREIEAAHEAEAIGRFREAWRCLELAHVIGQSRLRLHWMSHRAMLGLARRTADERETAAQRLRLVLTPIGHLVHRLPRFNPGSGRTGPFEPAAWPCELDPVSLERVRNLPDRSDQSGQRGRPGRSGGPR